ncbi:MAG: glycerol-3-phosphate 1-O-acyltransferase PlsY [Bacteroidia bacterium]|nr:glycerol-3-phosphate 1-O-acyltransferase PlsY [Bacteroidia bacterium]
MAVILLILAYLLGSIPTSVWVGRIFYRIDVREHGSGNAGATNTFRVLGPKAGIPVLLIDILKGYIAVSLSSFSGLVYDLTELKIGLAIMALMGHIFPLFAQFRGGKGVATLLGGVMGISPEIVFFSLLIFLAVLFISRMVSLASMLSGISYPFIILIKGNYEPVLLLFAITVALLLLVTHKKNIKRILQGQENKIPKFNIPYFTKIKKG